jgi:organic radical activating enzyme
MQPLAAHVVELFSSIQGEGLLAGEPQLFLRFYGCNMACNYCDTEAARTSTGPCRVEPARRYHSLALTGGEPLLHHRFLAAFLPAVREILPVFLETNGTLAAEVAALLPQLNWISMDVKLESATGKPTDWDGHRRFLRAAHEKLLCVKATVGPALQDAEFCRLVDLMAETDAGLPLILQPVHGTWEMPGWRERLFSLQGDARGRLRTVRILPQIHKLLKML